MLGAIPLKHNWSDHQHLHLDMLALPTKLEVSLPRNLQSLKLDVNGCKPWARKHLERFFPSLPRSLVA